MVQFEIPSVGMPCNSVVETWKGIVTHSVCGKIVEKTLEISSEFIIVSVVFLSGAQKVDR